MHSTVRRPTRTLTRCLVCGSSEVRTDAVVDRGVVLLHECPRCEHRWTAEPGRSRIELRMPPARVAVSVPPQRTRETPAAA